MNYQDKKKNSNIYNQNENIKNTDHISNFHFKNRKKVMISTEKVSYGTKIRPHLYVTANDESKKFLFKIKDNN